MPTHIPEPDQSPQGPRYEGRLLDRPEEEVVDQGVSFDMGTLISRRGLFGAGLAGAGTLALVACSTDSTTGGTASTPSSTETGSTTDLPDGEIPDETAGPYPGDGSNGPDVLEETGIVRRDIRSSIGADAPVDGVPLEFTFTITDMANDDAPFAGVAVYAWHCNAQGLYSMYSEGVEDESWLRGVQIADADGNVTFTSIMPGCYAGRWTHIHFEVYPDEASINDYTNAIATSQMAFPEDILTDVYELDEYQGSAQNLAQITLESDNVFGEDGAELQMATMSGDINSGYTASLTVRVDTTTEPTGGNMPENGTRQGPPPGDGGPGGQPPAGDPPNEPRS